LNKAYFLSLHHGRKKGISWLMFGYCFAVERDKEDKGDIFPCIFYFKNIKIY